MSQKCRKCGRDEPSGIYESSCSTGGYCYWIKVEPDWTDAHQQLIDMTPGQRLAVLERLPEWSQLKREVIEAQRKTHQVQHALGDLAAARRDRDPQDLQEARHVAQGLADVVEAYGDATGSFDWAAASPLVLRARALVAPPPLPPPVAPTEPGPMHEALRLVGLALYGTCSPPRSAACALLAIKEVALYLSDLPDRIERVANASPTLIRLELMTLARSLRQGVTP